MNGTRLSKDRGRSRPEGRAVRVASVASLSFSGGRKSLAERALWLLVLLSLFFVMGGKVQGDPEVYPEYKVKAAFLYQFLIRTTWPTNASPALTSPLKVGIVGEDPFGSELSSALNKTNIFPGGTPLIVHRQFGDDLSDCQLVFIARTEREHVEAILDSLQNKPVLTLSEIEGFCEAGGMFRYVIVKGTVRFEINSGAIEAAGLRVSATLGALGKRVKTVARSR